MTRNDYTFTVEVNDSDLEQFPHNKSMLIEDCPGRSHFIPSRLAQNASESCWHLLNLALGIHESPIALALVILKLEQEQFIWYLAEEFEVSLGFQSDDSNVISGWVVDHAKVLLACVTPNSNLAGSVDILVSISHSITRLISHDLVSIWVVARKVYICFIWIDLMLVDQVAVWQANVLPGWKVVDFGLKTCYVR